MNKAHIVEELEAGGYKLPVYAYRRPAELDQSGVSRVPVIVAGGGLTGLACATDLATRGVPCVLLDDDNTVGVRGASSRGIAYASKTLEILGRIGADGPVLEKGVTWTVGRTLDLEDELYSFDLSLESRSVYPPFVNIQQFYVEAAMVDRAYELGVDMRWQNKVVSAHFADDHVKLTVATPDGNYEIEADWVVDATGVNSQLREQAGIDVACEHADDKWCICDVRITAPLPFERRTWLRAPFNDNRAVWNHPMPDQVWRLDYHLAPDCDFAQVDEAYITKLVHRHYGDDIDVEVVWFGPWAYRQQLANRFRRGRLFLIGDAAHAFSPAGGRGGNSGIQDAENLAWKLALVVRGLAPEALLDSYNVERHAAASLNVALTAESMRFIAPPTAELLVRRNQILEAARTDVAARQQINTGKLSAPYVYEPSAHVMQGGHSLADRVLQRGDGGELRMCDLTGGPIAGVILDFSTERAVAEDLAARTEAASLPLRYQRLCRQPQAHEAAIDTDLLDEIGISQNSEAAVFVRPDGHVAVITDPATILDDIRRAFGLDLAHTAASQEEL